MPSWFASSWVKFTSLVLGISLAAGVFYGGILRPQKAEKAKLDEALQKTGLQIQKTLESFPEIDSLQRELEIEEKSVGSIRKKLSSYEARLNQPWEWEKFFTEKRLQFAAGEPIAEGPYSKEKFAVKSDGSFADIFSFLAEVESSPLAIRIESFNAFPSAQGIQAEISLEALTARENIARDRKASEISPSVPAAVLQNLFIYKRKIENAPPVEKGALV